MKTTFWLLMTLGLTASLWLPYVLNRFVRLGVWRTVANPQPGDREALAPWAQRAIAAHNNAIENLALFAPLALIVIVRGVGDDALAAGAAAAYFGARLVHVVVYVAGVPLLRTLAFSVGWAAQLALIAAALQSGVAL